MPASSLDVPRQLPQQQQQPAAAGFDKSSSGGRSSESVSDSIGGDGDGSAFDLFPAASGPVLHSLQCPFPTNAKLQSLFCRHGKSKGKTKAVFDTNSTNRMKNERD